MNRKGVFKTESILGNKEYSPSKSIAMGEKIPEEQAKAMDKAYKASIIERIKAYKPVAVNKYEFFKGLCVFNNDFVNPVWNWNDELFENFDVWKLRDLAILLERAENKK